MPQVVHLPRQVPDRAAGGIDDRAAALDFAKGTLGGHGGVRGAAGHFLHRLGHLLHGHGHPSGFPLLFVHTPVGLCCLRLRLRGVAVQLPGGFAKAPQSSAQARPQRQLRKLDFTQSVTATGVNIGRDRVVHNGAGSAQAFAEVLYQ